MEEVVELHPTQFITQDRPRTRAPPPPLPLIAPEQIGEGQEQKSPVEIMGAATSAPQEEPSSPEELNVNENNNSSSLDNAQSRLLAALPRPMPPNSRKDYQSPLRPSQYITNQEEESTPQASTTTNSNNRISMEEVLLRKRWSLHCISQLIRFQRAELGDYAHELVKYLREAAMKACHQEYGYRVSIRNTKTFVVFYIQEDRDFDAYRERRCEQQHQQKKMQNNRMEHANSLGLSGIDGSTARTDAKTHHRRSTTDGNEVDDMDAVVPQRKGAFVLYLPEDSRHGVPPRPSQITRRSSIIGNAATGSGEGGEAQNVLLLRGNEQLMAWACSWLQRRFQCVVSKHVVRISAKNLKRLARNWVLAALMASYHSKPPANNSNSEEKTDTAEKPRGPLLLKFQNVKPGAVMRSYTLTVPWMTLQRIFEQADGKKAKQALEIIELTEQMYFDLLPFDITSFELRGVETDDVEMDHIGHIEFFSMSLVHPILHTLVEFLAAQSVHGPFRPSMTL